MQRSARVQAKTVRVREHFVAERFGEDARQRYLTSVTPGLRALLGSKDEPPGGWVDFALFVEANEVADKLFGRGDMALAWDAGRFAATHNAGVWRSLLLRHIRPSTFLGIAAGLWSSHYEGGKLITRAHGSDGVVATLSDFPTPHRAHCLSIAGWLVGSLEIGPRKEIRVEESTCRALGGRSCEFRVVWRD